MRARTSKQMQHDKTAWDKVAAGKWPRYASDRRWRVVMARADSGGGMLMSAVVSRVGPCGWGQGEGERWLITESMMKQRPPLPPVPRQTIHKTQTLKQMLTKNSLAPRSARNHSRPTRNE